jgi:hypothetical protein
MLPILRILPVGGVLLAILILVLALSPPDGSRAPLSSAMATGRGVLADRDRQSEVRQYLIHAALKRADELNRLRDLPDTPARAEEAPPKVAGLPSDRTDADPEETAAIPETPVVTIPIEIGEPSSVELRRRRCHSRRRKRNCRLSRKPSRPNRGRIRAVASTAPARTHGSRPSRPSLASTISSRCFSGDLRVNNRRTAPRRKAAASSRLTRSKTSNPRMAASSSIISGL